MIARPVPLYPRFALSVRDVEELRRRETRPARTWHLDEMATRIGGRVHWLWRAVDEHGQTLDVRPQERRDAEAAERFFRRLLATAARVPPARITTDELGSYAAALGRVPELAGVAHLQVRSALRCNSRVEQAHQPTRLRERVMRRFKSAASARRFLEAFSRAGNLFRPGRHRLSAAVYRAAMGERVATWHAIAGLQAA